eukprot:13867257-Alexandrium_andersonii.AAC.1
MLETVFTLNSRPPAQPEEATVGRRARDQKWPQNSAPPEGVDSARLFAHMPILPTKQANGHAGGASG